LPSATAQTGGNNNEVILLDRYDDDTQSFGPGGDTVFKWLLYTPVNDTRYLVIITATADNSKFRVDVSSEGDENLIVDTDKIIYVRLTVTTDEEVDDIETEIEITFRVRPLVQGREEFILTKNVIAKMETPKPAPVVEVVGFEFTPPGTEEYLENRWIRFVVEVVIYLLLSVIVLFLISPVIHTFTGKTKTKIDDMVVEMMRWPIFLLLVTWGLLQAVKALHLPPSAMATFSNIWFVLALIIVTFVGIKIFRTLTVYFGKIYAKKTKMPVDHILVPVLTKIGTIIIVFFCLMFALDKFGIDITVFLTGMGIMGLVIAFAAQDTLSNFFGGIFLIIEPKFKTGDQVMIADKYYVVEEIGMRTTVLHDKSSNQDVIVPNNKLANEMIINMMEPDMYYRVGVKASAAYGSDIDKVEKIMKDVAGSNPKVMLDKDHSIYFEFSEMGASSLDFLVKVWITDLNDRWGVPHDIRTGIYKRFISEGIEIPYDQLDVHIRSAPKQSENGKKEDLLDI